MTQAAFCFSIFVYRVLGRYSVSGEQQGEELKSTY
jgi:hypothetical protein